jgi:glyoxylase-like metal-dependent hydrolase (beta-lactamase superfamily II)
MEASEVAPGVWRAGSRYVNWYVVDAGEAGLTVVDAGLPGYARGLDGVLAHLGHKRSDVRAVALTHGHIDHVGMAVALSRAGAAVHLHPADTAIAADPRRNETERPLRFYLTWPATLAFVVHAVTHGAARPPGMPVSVPLVDGDVADVPGRPLVTHVPGHTDGSCILEFRDHGVAFVGDLLCTVSPMSGRPACPQLQTRGSNRNSAQALASLDRLEAVQAPVVLPGHGGPWRDGVAAAVASARRVGCR